VPGLRPEVDVHGVRRVRGQPAGVHLDVPDLLVADRRVPGAGHTGEVELGEAGGELDSLRLA
jgi:hypothetical protein